MERHRAGVARWRPELWNEEKEEMMQMIQTLQIQVQGMSNQWLTVMEILAEHHQEQHQMKDEHETLRSEIEELKNRPTTPLQTSNNTTITEEASSPAPKPDIPNLNSMPNEQVNETCRFQPP
jgi:hypothetical protein